MELRARGAAGLAALLAVAAFLAAAAPPPAPAAEVTRPASKTRPPPLFKRTAREVRRIADRNELVRRERRAHPHLKPTATYTSGRRWQVSYHERGRELVQVKVDDRTGAVLEAWRGPQVAWKMARGHEGAFGRKVNAPYVWIPLCLLFLAPFVDPRRPLRLLHLDLAVMLAFGASHVFFNRGEIATSVPLVYPVLAYLLVRMLVAGFRPREGAGPLVPLVPAAWLTLGLVFLVGFRVALNVTDSNVIDVGYAGVIGADRIADGDPLYEGSFPADNDRGDTYGPVTYLTYVPFEQLFSWSGEWDDLPAAHAAALCFDLLTIGALLLLGRRLRPGAEGRRLGLALAFAWAAYPYTLFALESNTNDSLIALLLVLALLALRSAPGRGALTALAAAAKFAPAALAPLLAAGTGERRLRSSALFLAAFAAVVALTFLPFVPDGGLREVWDRTVGYQAGRDTPFSIWGEDGALAGLQAVVTAGAVLLAAAVFFLPRRRSPAQVAALAAAVLIAVQLAADYWFYLYIVWFAPLVLVALFSAHRDATGRAPTPAPAGALEGRRPEPEPALR